MLGRSPCADERGAVGWPSEGYVVRHRFRHHDRRDRRERGSASTAWILALVALGYGLFLWIISVFTIVVYEFARFREFWSVPSTFGVSNFNLSLLVSALFATLVVLSASAEWRASEGRPWSLLATFAASLTIVAAWSVNFYGMATIPLNDAWYFDAISEEPYDVHRIYLGQVLSSEPCGTCPDGVEALAVELEISETVLVNAPIAENPVGSIVSVRELRGRFTGSPRHEFGMSVGADDPQLFKSHWFRDIAR